MPDWRLVNETPSETIICPVCGGIVNASGQCMDSDFHDDPTEPWMDDEVCPGEQ